MNTPARAAAGVKCPHCGGPIETVGRGRTGAEIQRCSSCGREPNESTQRSNVPATTRMFAGVAADSAPRPCRVDGCPGILDNAGACACCAKREVWAAANVPKRYCPICGGLLSGSRLRKRCEPCGKLVVKTDYIRRSEGEEGPKAGD